MSERRKKKINNIINMLCSKDNQSQLLGRNMLSNCNYKELGAIKYCYRIFSQFCKQREDGLMDRNEFWSKKDVIIDILNKDKCGKIFLRKAGVDT